MIKAEAWLQCSARGITVTRLTYIGGFPLLRTKEGTDREREGRDPGTLVHSPSSFISHLKLSPLYHHTARGATCTCCRELYTD